MKLLDIPAQTPTAEVDEEILEIFVEEVQEVLEEIVRCLTAWKDDPADTDSLQTLRRAFHTLKGSGRLVGATVIGELGWRFENMLNRVIDGSLTRNDTLLSLLNQVETVLPEMIEQFKNDQLPPHSVVLLISQADYFTQTKGKSMGEFEAADGTTAEVKPKSVVTKPVTSSTAKEVANVEVEEPEEEIVEEAFTESEKELMPEESLSTSTETTETLAEEDFKLFTDETIPQATLSPVEGSETVDLSELPDTELINDSDFADLTLSEEVTTPEFAESGAFNDLSIPESLANLTDEDGEVLDPILINIFLKEASQHLADLRNIVTACEDSSNAIEQDIVRAFHTLNGSSRSVNFTAISTIAAPLENYTRALSERQAVPTPAVLRLLRTAVDQIEHLLQGQPVPEEQQRVLLEDVQVALDSLPPIVVPSPKKIPTVATDTNDEFMAIFLEEADEILENTQSLLERWTSAPNNMQLMKELQRELHTLKGGARMVGIVAMGDLSHELESILTRIVEGNAHSNAKLQDIVQNSVDELAAMLEAVRSGVALEMPTDLINQISASLAVESGTTSESMTLSATSSPTATVDDKKTTKPIEEPETAKATEKTVEKDSDLEGGEDRIRVRVTLIDKLTNLAGELSISRAHMEQQQGALKSNIVEMEQTILRLRDQLRRLEIETEAQILSHFGGVTVENPTKPDHEEFDPLELDRFSGMQQLSRSLMESVSDLLSIQDFLKMLTRQSDTLLVQQSRIGAELQEGIMRTRMIPFSRISPRLQRIARLTARELRKQVEFIINGESIEFERTVLNRIVAPLEHMLRNAIGHGIEEAEARQQAGKPTVAKITIDLSREGADLIIKLSDDGAGLNLPAIRRKAEERGMLKPGTVVSDRELMQFILEPSFSTAQAITQVSGRGVGMDVANTEIKSLGGSLQIHSKMGEGTLFEIRLPLSLTINKALMIHVGEETMAVPLNNVDAVMRAPRQEILSDGKDSLYYSYMGNNYRVFHLGELLGFGRVASLDAALIPTLLIRAGEHRVALVVDGIEGSKEIVVKSVGPQIGSIRWIAGATILGDGRVVLILDVPTLARADTTPYHSEIAMAERRAAEPAPEKVVVPVTIMVVDDSITVRKVTARLLKRQGMEVLTAKDGVDAVAQLQEHTPDLILLDVEMPRMDGYELATQIRNTAHLKHLPIIMITSRTGAKHRDRADKIGINRYLGKPFNETELLQNINALLDEQAANPASFNIAHS